MDKEFSIRTARPGNAGLAACLQMRLYREEYGLKPVFEYYLFKGMAEFLRDPAGSRLWVAEAEGAVVGSIAVVKLGGHSAQLRWFAVGSAMRGIGIGNALMDAAMAFCRECGYAAVELWTLDILLAARHLYSKYGFAPTETKTNTEWAGHPLTEEKWELLPA